MKEQSSSKWGIMSLVLGILTLILCWIPLWGFLFALLAIVISGISLKKETNKGLVITGLVLGIIGLIIAIVISLMALLTISLYTTMTSPSELKGGSSTNNGGTGKTTELQLNIGETAKTTLLEVIVLSAKASDFYQYYSSLSKGNSVERAGIGKKFIIIDAEIKGIGDTASYVSPASFSLVDFEGYKYNAGVYSGDDGFSYQQIYSNQKARGKILFEVPENAKELKVQYNFGLLDVKLAKWSIADTLPIERISSKMSAKIEIRNIKVNWMDYLGYGTISSIDYTVTNTGEVPIDPSFDVTISRGNSEVYSKRDDTSSFFGNVESGKSVKESILLYLSELYGGSYSIKVDLRNGKEEDILSTTVKNISIG